MGCSLYSQDLTYKPRNPNFGGDTFNYQWLQGSADSQNKFKDPEEENNRFEQPSELERFKENLNSQLLSYLSRALFEDKFGTGVDGGGTGNGNGNGTGNGGTGSGLQPGVYTFGSLSVELYNSNLGLVVNVLDITTGEETQIIIPQN